MICIEFRERRTMASIEENNAKLETDTVPEPEETDPETRPTPPSEGTQIDESKGNFIFPIL